MKLLEPLLEASLAFVKLHLGNLSGGDRFEPWSGSQEIKGLGEKSPNPFSFLPEFVPVTYQLADCSRPFPIHPSGSVNASWRVLGRLARTLVEQHSTRCSWTIAPGQQEGVMHWETSEQAARDLVPELAKRQVELAPPADQSDAKPTPRAPL